MGSSTENSAFGPTRNPLDPARVPGGSLGRVGRRGRRGHDAARARLGHRRVDPPAGRALRPGRGQAHLRPGLAGTGSSPSPARSTRSGRSRPRSPTRRSCLEVIAGHDPRDSTSLPEPAPSLLARLDDGVAGRRVGLVAELVEGADSEVAAAVARAAEVLEAAGATLVEVSIPEVRLGLSAYYLMAPAEASSNLARYDGVRYGLRVDADDVASMNVATRTAGFGDEVKRRIMLGTYALSAGYYDAYYGQALKVRTRTIEAFARAYERCDILLGATTPGVAFEFGTKTADPMQMYLNDVFTIPTNLTGEAAVSVPFGTGEAGLPVGVQLVGPGRSEAGLLAAARVLEVARGPGMTLPDGVELVVGLEVHTELQDRDQALLRLRQRASAPSPTPGSARSAWACPGRCRCSTCARSSSRWRWAPRCNCSVVALDLPPQELLLPRHAQGLPDQPVRPADQRRRLPRPARRQPGGDRARALGGGHGQVDAPGRRAGASTAPTAPWSTTTAPGCRWSRSSRSPTCARPPRPAPTSPSCARMLVAVGASDGKMEEGSMRVDANVSVHRAGEPYGTRCEIKNLNSLRSLGRAIEFEAQRQVDLVAAGGAVRQETRHWDENDGTTSTLRSKEEAEDYRYFREPDLVDLVPDARVGRRRRRGAGPELPAEPARPPGRAPGRGQRRAGRRGRGRSSTRWPSTTTCTPRPTPGSTRRLALTRAANELAGDGRRRGDLRADAFAEVVAPRGRPASSRATQAKAVLADLLARAADPRRDRRGARVRARSTTTSSDDARDAALGGPPGRVGALPRRRGQGRAVLRRPGHEGHARAAPTARRSSPTCRRAARPAGPARRPAPPRSRRWPGPGRRRDGGPGPRIARPATTTSRAARDQESAASAGPRASQALGGELGRHERGADREVQVVQGAPSW